MWDTEHPALGVTHLWDTCLSGTPSQGPTYCCPADTSTEQMRPLCSQPLNFLLICH